MDLSWSSKLMEKLLFYDSFFEQLKTFNMRVIFTGYTLIGGVYFDERVKPRFRKIWTCYNIGSTMAVGISCTFYLTDLTIYNPRTILIGCVPVFSSLTKVIYSLMTCYHREEIKGVMDFLISDATPDYFATNANRRGNRIVNMGKWVISVFAVVTVALMAYAPSGSAEFLNQNATLTRHDHVMYYFPMWCPYERSVGVGWTMGIFQGMMLLPDVIFTFAGSAFFLAIIAEIFEKFITLCHQLVIYSRAAFREFMRLDGEEEEALELNNTIIRRNMLLRLDVRRVAVASIFYADFLRFMGRHQQLQRLVKLAMGLLEGYFSVNSLGLFSLTVAVAMLSENSISDWMVEIFGGILTLLCVWLICCVVGHLLMEVNEMVTNQVYSMPWYHFSPWYGHTVHTFLTTIRQPMILQAWKVIPLTFNFMLKCLSYVFSLVQILLAIRRR